MTQRFNRCFRDLAIKSSKRQAEERNVLSEKKNQLIVTFVEPFNMCIVHHWISTKPEKKMNIHTEIEIERKRDVQL